MNCTDILENYQCRTCYNATKGLKLLTSLTKYGSKQQQKSLAELLKEISNINVMDDLYKELPQYICDNCARKLKTAYAFIQQAREVNERLITMIMDHSEAKKRLDCLEEAQMDVQSCLEIKMELDEVDAQEVSEVQCAIEMKVEETEEVSEINHLNEDVLSTKKDVDGTIDLLNDLKKVNDSSFNVEENIRNENIVCKKLSKDNEKKESDIFLSNDEKDDEDYQDNQSDDTEWQDESDNTYTKNKNKTNNTKSKSTEMSKSLEDDDIAVICSQCNKIFNNSKSLARHQRTSHIPEDQKCTCPLCFRKFTRSCSMYTHMRTFHGPDTIPFIRKPLTQERIFQCDKCTRNYTKKKHLNTHIKNKHSNVNEKRDNEKSAEVKSTKEDTGSSGSLKSGPSKTYEVRSLCSICGSSFSSKTHLIVHMRRHTGELPFKCDLCDRAYPRVSELKYHRRIHTGEKPYVCKTCGKAFRVSSKMTTHMRSHTDIRPYKCTQCERSFKYSKDLNIHFRIHTGERPYCCNVCGSTFTQSNTLKAHRVKLGHLENYNKS